MFRKLRKGFYLQIFLDWLANQNRFSTPIHLRSQALCKLGTRTLCEYRYISTMTIAHIRVHVCLLFKASLSAKFLL